MTDPIRITIPLDPGDLPYITITPTLARRAGLPLALSFDGRGNPQWHWMNRHD